MGKLEKKMGKGDLINSLKKNNFKKLQKKSCLFKENKNMSTKKIIK